MVIKLFKNKLIKSNLVIKTITKEDYSNNLYKTIYVNINFIGFYN